MTFSIVYWNTWLYSQLNGNASINKYNKKTGIQRLLSDLGQLIDQHQPDIIGLNEIIYFKPKKAAFVLKFLRQRGYSYQHYATSGPFNDDCLNGVALCSRFKLDDVQELRLCENSSATKRGYPGHDLKAITAQIALPKGPTITVIVAHAMAWASPKSDSLPDHYASIKTLAQLMHTEQYAANTILGGDMNQPGFMPKALKRRLKDTTHYRTGSILHPTWLHNAQSLTPIRSNLDYVYWSHQSDFVIKDFSVLHFQASDHKPLLITFQY